MQKDGSDVTRQAIRKEYETTRSEFRATLDSLSDEDLRRKSLNAGWTNGEILFHITFGFVILSSLVPLVRFLGRLPPGWSRALAGVLNAFTGFFNWINALGARVGGRAFRGRNVGSKYDRTYAALMKKLDAVRPDEWHRGMYYPTRWDSLFKEYMTLEDVFRYPVIHFRFHKGQISHPASQAGHAVTPTPSS